MENHPKLSPEFIDSASRSAPTFINKTEKDGDKVNITLDNMTIKLEDDDVVLIDKANIEINQGDKVAFTGPNGSGKSSLFRVMRDLQWEGSGNVVITKPEDFDIFCSPQELRKATITLPGILSYRYPPENYSHEEYEDVLEKVGMGRLIRHLPWNAVKPDNIMHHAKEHLDSYITPLIGNLNGSGIEQFMKQFRKTLDTELDMPTPLQGVYNDDIHHHVLTHLCDHTEHELKTGRRTEILPFFLTKRAAKKAARAVAENTRDSLDSWLLQGHRMRLSGGEQQKLVFARILLQKPDILLLDEITSALKEDTEREYYEMMLEALPDSTMISIIHNDDLLELHTHHLELHDDKSLTITPVDQAYLEARQRPTEEPAPKPSAKPSAP